MAVINYALALGFGNFLAQDSTYEEQTDLCSAFTTETKRFSSVRALVSQAALVNRCGVAFHENLAAAHEASGDFHSCAIKAAFNYASYIGEDDKRFQPMVVQSYSLVTT